MSTNQRPRGKQSASCNECKLDHRDLDYPVRQVHPQKRAATVTLSTPTLAPRSINPRATRDSSMLLTVENEVRTDAASVTQRDGPRPSQVRSERVDAPCLSHQRHAGGTTDRKKRSSNARR